MLHGADHPPVLDLSSDTSRHVIIAQGTPEVYQGHPTTLLLPDGKTMYVVWTYGHGGGCGPMKRSDDGGKTWSDLLPVPENWKDTRNCPALYRLTDPQGVSRLFVFAGQGPGGTRQPDNGTMNQSYSMDDGKTWTPMKSNDLNCVMPFCTIMPVDGGKRLIGLSNIRRPGETKDTKSNIITQSESTDGGLTWSPWRVLVDLGDLKPCEPEVVRSPDGKQLLCLIRENIRSHDSHYIISNDEGRNWSDVKSLPPGLHGDRHKAQYAPDGRLVVTFRDMGAKSPTRNHFVAWVGRYEDIQSGKDGEYKIKLLHSYARSDCGYPGLEVLPDGTFVATTYVKYREGPEKHSVVSTRFLLKETDAMEKKVIEVPAGKTSKVAGILLDDDKAKYTGKWINGGDKRDLLVGGGYRTTNGDGAATFTPDIPAAGRYELRLLYVPSGNRSDAVSVTIHSAEGKKTVTQNQRENCLEESIPRSLGVYEFAKGKAGSVQIAAKAKAGFVVVDGLQIVPEADAKVERNTRADAGFPVMIETPKPTVKIPAPMTLKSAAKAADVDGKSYDLVVIGGTPGGIATAVRAAREGLKVLLVNHTQHLGGFITSGAGGWEAPYDGLRAPLYGEMLTGAASYYSKTYGENSPQHLASMPDAKSRAHIDRPKVEPRIAEMLFNQMVEKEKSLTVLLGHTVKDAVRDGALLKSVTLQPMHGKGSVKVSATLFADGMYEGDLIAAAGVKSQIGREARSQYNEPHAGVIYTAERKKEPGQRGFPKDADEGRLNIRYNSHATAEIIEGPQSGEADGSVMAYNYRLILTRDPANKIMVEKHPKYDVEMAKMAGGSGFVPNLPNNKVAWNGGRLIGPQNEYPGGDWPTREKISRLYMDTMRMRLWYFQNDPAVPEKERKYWEGWGLAADEFPDNNHEPYEIYVREARRLVGRAVFTEHDNKVPAGIGRTPINTDSIAITDWPVDSVACLKRKVPGGHEDGIFFLGEESRPAQVPYRCLLAQDLDNLLVSVAISASHVGWGSIRLEPVWMQMGESAGFAAALAIKNKTTPGKLNPDLLIRALVKNRVMISFFNDVDVTSDDPRVPAAQYFGSKGFFSTYDARLDEPLSESEKAVWMDGFEQLQKGTLDPMQLAKAVHASSTNATPQTKQTRGAALLAMWNELEAQ
ncbi:flavin-dependent dehydrogenase [Prosthecobacter fusiformis]|uniref:Flavin-dependent dehydrogenase n=2 Tax=Prosthecobacter fusiformis TaxID=48464 RepID=A0A4R7RNH0_9BACT|nr:flavin-dependent dehydrogenase [Prosthecobacter fusiformis]